MNLSHQENNDLDELILLLVSAGGEAAGAITTTRARPTANYYIGQGKVEELALLVTTHEASLVVFNNDLTPSQQRNLEKILSCRVLDRTEIILDIFARRARTFEGKLQVELAQLTRLSTRLVRGWTHLERQKGGIGLRGPGETQLETDRRIIQTRIKALSKQLDKVRKQREQGRRQRKRKPVPTIALVGYTNVGKSSLFNVVSHAEVLVEDQFFATLDPTVRRIPLPTLGEVVLADTVGFIRGLPHTLVDAFRATLEEVVNADLLLHVVDASDPHRHDHMHKVEDVLHEIGAEHVPVLLVYNKIDKLQEKDIVPHIDVDEDQHAVRVWVSVAKQWGLPLLKTAIEDRLCQEWIHCGVSLKPQETQLRAWLYENGAILEDRLTDDGNWQLEVRFPFAQLQKFLGFDRIKR